MRHRVVIAFVFAAMVAALPARAWAQGDSKNGLSFSYAYLKVNGDSHYGFAVDFTRDLTTKGNTLIRAIGEGAFVHGAPRDVSTAIAGLQFAWAMGHLLPLASVGVGVSHASSQNQPHTNAAIEYGFGADWKISEVDRWRVHVMYDWLTTLGDRGETGWRFIAGAQRRF